MRRPIAAALALGCLLAAGCGADRHASSLHRDFVIEWDGCLTLCAQLELAHPHYVVATYIDPDRPRFALWYLAELSGDTLAPVLPRGVGPLRSKWRQDRFRIDPYSAAVTVLEDEQVVGSGQVVIDDRLFDSSLDAVRRRQPPGHLDHLRRQARGAGLRH